MTPLLAIVKHYSIFIIIFWGLCSCTNQNTNTIESLQGHTMGTVYHIKYLNNTHIQPVLLQQEIDLLLVNINQKMSTYIPDSELSQFNQLTAINQPFIISDDLAKVIIESKRINQITLGHFDITVGPLVNLWGFGPEYINKKVTKKQIQERKSWIGMDKLDLSNINHNIIQKKNQHLYLDLSGIAKGFAVDQIADFLESKNIKNYLIEIGGEIKTKGKKNTHTPWVIAIEKPSHDFTQKIQMTLNISNIAMATSGNYRNILKENGQEYGHEINPITKNPAISDIVSISVWDKSCMTADGLATGLYVLGSKKALEVATNHHLPVYIISKIPQGSKVISSPAYQQLLAQQK